MPCMCWPRDRQCKGANILLSQFACSRTPIMLTVVPLTCSAACRRSLVDARARSTCRCSMDGPLSESLAVYAASTADPALGRLDLPPPRCTSRNISSGFSLRTPSARRNAATGEGVPSWSRRRSCFGTRPPTPSLVRPVRLTASCPAGSLWMRSAWT